MEEYFEIGQIVNTNGLKGVVKIKPFTDDITKFDKIKSVFIERNNTLEKFNIQKVWYHKNMVMLKLENIDSIEAAEALRNLYIKVLRDKSEELPQNVYYIQDIEKCEVYTDENIFLGIISGVFATGSNDVYVVKTSDNKEILLPAISDVIKAVDIENKKIIVHLLPGLI